jgi:hypothetical protein
MCKPWLRALGLVAALLSATSCATPSGLQSRVLCCRTPFQHGSFVGLHSLERGELSVPPASAAQVDLVYYFDADDCSRGALLGNDDKPGFLFPIGHQALAALAGARPPGGTAGSVAAIAPLTKDLEGLAFWLRTGGGEFVLMRIVAVQEATHADLVAGVTPGIELQWLPARPAAGR